MPEPSQFVRIKRFAVFSLKETFKKRTQSKLVEREFAKKYPQKVLKYTTWIAKKTTRKITKGKQVSSLYAKKFPSLVRKVIIYKTKPSVKIYKKGTRVTESFAFRYPAKVKSTEYIVIEERQPVFDPILRKQTYGKWKITSRQKMNFYEQILPVKQLSERHVRMVFSRYHIFRNIWENRKGIIRVTVNGHTEHHRVKEVVHIGYLKSVWEGRHNGYSEFKDYVVNKVLQGLRRKNLRLSNPKESYQRLKDLYRKRSDAMERVERATYLNRETAVEGLKEVRKLIQQQKRSRQILGGTIKIEKLVE